MSLKLAVAAALVAGTLAIFSQTATQQFVSYDDEQYVSTNPIVQSGITLSSLKWAMTTFHGSNWQPMTWLSHMADCWIYGLNPAGHHMTSVAIHAANVLLLFLLFCGLTGCLWESAFVAAFFSLHPLHVESVAWIAERKDVLSTFWGLISLLAYVGFARRRETKLYGLAIVSFAFSLMSKSMLVTLPFVMLLLDYWPLGRITQAADIGGAEKCGGQRTSSVRLLLIEKIPFLMLTAVSCIITFAAQVGRGALAPLDTFSFSARFANVLISYLQYIGKMLRPVDLAAIYPLQLDHPLAQVVGAGVVILLCSALAIWQARRRPYLFVGWFWYLGTLVPVIGFVKAGNLIMMADRYTYVPLTGLFIIAAWGGAEFIEGSPLRRNIIGTVAGLLLFGCALLTWTQLSYWQDSTALYTHAIEVTKENYTAETGLGVELGRQGRHLDAIQHFTSALRIYPDYPLAHVKLGMTLMNIGNLDEAIAQFKEALLHSPNYVEAFYYLGLALARQNKYEEAFANLSESIRIDPYFLQGYYAMGIFLSRQGNYDAAAEHLTYVLRLNPNFFDARQQLELIQQRRERNRGGAAK